MELKCFLIWGDWLSCDPLRGSHDSQSPHTRYVIDKLDVRRAVFCSSLSTHRVLVAEESAAPTRHTAVVTTMRGFVTLTTLATFTASVSLFHVASLLILSMRCRYGVIFLSD